jgi:L-fucose isomerase-like protein
MAMNKIVQMMNLEEKWCQKNEFEGKVVPDSCRFANESRKLLENAIDCDKLSIKYGLSISFFPPLSWTIQSLNCLVKMFINAAGFMSDWITPEKRVHCLGGWNVS